MVKTLVLGIGNPILSDDAVGLRVIDELQNFSPGAEVQLLKDSSAGINLLEILSGFDRAILVDAIQTGTEPGTVFCLTPEDIPARQKTPHLHNLDLLQVLVLGKELAPAMPSEVSIIAIEAKDVTTFGEDLTPEVKKAVPLAVQQILAQLRSERETETLR